jgi:RNA polymerase sigma-70 factor (sigma-E family)
MPTTTRSPALADDREHNRRRRLVQLYEAEHAGMVRLAHLLTGSVPTAEDLVQEAFVKVYERIDDVAEPGAYLRRAVVNLATSHHRRRAVADRWQRRQPPPTDALPPDVDETWQLLRDLPEAQRTVLVLRFYLDLKVDDIAAVLEVPAGTVKSQIHRGLAALSGEVIR